MEPSMREVRYNVVFGQMHPRWVLELGLAIFRDLAEICRGIDFA
jgi:hypothetical protein